MFYAVPVELGPLLLEAHAHHDHANRCAGEPQDVGRAAQRGVHFAAPLAPVPEAPEYTGTLPPSPACFSRAFSSDS